MNSNILYDYYAKSFTDKSWDYLQDKCVVYPDKNRYRKNITDSLYVDLFVEKHNEMKKTNKKFIAVIEDTEGHWMETNLHKNLHDVIEQANVPAQNILVITPDEPASKNYSNWCDGGYTAKEKINFISSQCYIQRQLSLGGGTSESWVNRNWSFTSKEKTSKKFICLMGVKTPIRNTMWDFYESNKFVKNQGYISYLHKNVILPNSWVDSIKNGEGRIKNAESGPQIDNLVSYYKDSYFSVVSETNSALWFTEKIMKPLLHSHPFMVFNSNIGFIKLLKKYGFETFPEWFDESYDEIENIDERIQFIKKEIDRLCHMSNKDLYKMYKSVEDKLIHNRNNLLNLSKIIEEKFINDLMEISK